MKQVRRFMASILPTEEERQWARLKWKHYNERWASFFWGMIFATIIWSIIYFVKS